MLLDIKNRFRHSTHTFSKNADMDSIREQASASGLRISEINNRRYLGNKHSIADFIRTTIEQECPDVESIIDIFSGTGAVANAFIDKTVITNDLLYSNYLAHYCWFMPEDYRPGLILEIVKSLNEISTSESNYVRDNFADTYFSADDCSKIGAARELVESLKTDEVITFKEFSILVTSILYGMDRIANTVGHYDAFRKNVAFDKVLEFPLLLPKTSTSRKNQVYNADSNQIIESLKADVLYCDPPYNSRQYSDAYHLLENIAQWSKPQVYGVAKKMDRKSLKSEYNTIRAPEAMRDLIAKANVKYIVFSYNNMSTKGNGRSNAKISDTEIWDILSSRGEVNTFEVSHRAFNAGKSRIEDNKERLFICKVRPQTHNTKAIVQSPINYIGGKGKLIAQLQPLLHPSENLIDLFAGGCTVGANSASKSVVFNDKNSDLVALMNFLSSTDPKSVIDQIDSLINHYGLSNTYLHSYEKFGCTSSAGLSTYNKAPYMALREDFNETNEQSKRMLLLYCLIIFGFNNQLRFNRKGKFNLPVGKRDFNAKMRKKLTDFYTRMQEVEYSFSNLDFRKFEVSSTSKDTLFYCDPPYLITQATYNEQGGWSDEDERALLAFLDEVDRKGRKFALSNVTEAKGRVNRILQDWMNSRTNYQVHKMEMSYTNSNYQRSNRESITTEVLITNY